MTFTRVVSDELAERAGQQVPRHEWHRARPLPAVGMPVERRRRRLEVAISIALHVLVIWALVRPPALTNLNPDIVEMEKGGGGPGPAGGGGGGTRGTGGVKFVQVPAAPKPAVEQPKVEPVVPPVQPAIELPKPVVPEPVIPKMELPKLATLDPATEVKVQSPITGTGGGTGNDGTSGNGPGSGGGIGSGTGTGRGSGVGSGTGGGNLPYYPCQPAELHLPALPVPDKLSGTKVLANFDVDERGKVLKFEFTPTRDGGYNRRLNDVFKGYRFKPATTLEGVPIRAPCQVEIIL